jgi:hypothetical protein
MLAKELKKRDNHDEEEHQWHQSVKQCHKSAHELRSVPHSALRSQSAGAQRGIGISLSAIDIHFGLHLCDAPPIFGAWHPQPRSIAKRCRLPYHRGASAAVNVRYLAGIHARAMIGVGRLPIVLPTPVVEAGCPPIAKPHPKRTGVTGGFRVAQIAVGLIHLGTADW